MASVRVEVVYALADEQQVVLVEVEEGTRALDAVKASGIAGIDYAGIRLGRFGREISSGARVADGDRIEILRPLTVSPMEARRLRARGARRR